MSLVVLALSGAPALVFRGPAGERAANGLALLGAFGGLTAAILTLASGATETGTAPWQLPNALLALRLDPLAAAFLLPVLFLSALTSVYGLGYWPGRERVSAGRVRVFMGLLVAGMSTVIVAAHAILFLVAWETMALAAFFLVATEDENASVREAAWMYLIATHAGTLVLFALFAVLRGACGSFLLGPVPQTAGLTVTSTIFLLALAGFGLKAGLFPLHFWLPGAHANAPSHVSAILSGALLKVGIYGLVRILLFLPDSPVWWGGLLVVLGLGSALAGISLAISQSDLKRALAYSSVENIGIIVVALGLFVLGRANGIPGGPVGPLRDPFGIPALAALGLAAAIGHVWNHSLFKGLLFLSAGSVLHATGTRRIDLLGGLLRQMPVTGTAFLIGAVSAAALPGANAFVSEAILYLGLVEEAPRGNATALAAAVLALAGALAVACFVRLTGAMFLGSPRSDAALEAHEAPLTMRAPLVVLSAACLALGVFPAAVASALETVTGAPGVVAPFLIALGAPVALAFLATALTVLALVASTRKSPRRATWDCGYARPTASMQYTARSLSEWFTSRLLPRFLSPAIRLPVLHGLHPSAGSAVFGVNVDEPFTDRVLLPFAARWGVRAMQVRRLQHGRLPLYLLYILVTLLASIAWAVVFPLLWAGR